jgi:putative ABC transport system permease protein
MTRLWLFLIGALTPQGDREWVVGDTLEELDRVRAEEGPPAARRWLRREALRVLAHGPRHWLATRAENQRHQATRGDRAMTAVWQDIRYALRLLGRAPGFTSVAIATLALGIGANTAMFAVVNAVLLKPLPFKAPDRLMLVHLLWPDRQAGPGVYREGVWSYPKYRTFQEVQHTFDDAALFAGRDINLSGADSPERVRGEVVTDRYPEVLGIVPILGRSFTYEEANREGTPPVVMLGHGLWSHRYGSDPGIIGRSIDINATAYTVIGVLPRGFKGLTGVAELWAPLAAFEPSQLRQRFSHSYTIVGRRKEGVSQQEAQAAVRVYGSHVDAQHRDRTGTSASASAASLYASRADTDIRRASFVLLGAVGFVLLIACVNLTNLLAAKALARRREVAVRVAIGASRGRIARQFLVESVLLSALGAAAGVAVASGLLAAAAMLLPDPDVFFRTSMAPGVPRITGAAGLTRVGASMIGFDGRTLLFTCGVAIMTAGLIALVPAFRASTLRPFEALRSSGWQSGRGFSGLSARGLLVTVQIALALVLLTGAGLLIKSAARLQSISIGVDPTDVLTVRMDLPRPFYTNEKGHTFYTYLLARLGGISGVESAGLANCPPVSGGCNGTLIVFKKGPWTASGKEPVVGIHWATPEYFSTFRIRLLAGRLFDGRDRVGQPKVALVNETAARTFWPNDTPIGKFIGVGQGGFEDGAEVIGVVADVRYHAIETAPTPDVYIPVAQSFQSRMRLFVRSQLDTQTLVGAIRREVRALDPNLPLSEVKTMEERVGDAMWRTRVGAWLLSAFAALALVLTAIGIFGVMAQTVTQRTSEIGIRMALGAQRRDVLTLVLGSAARVTVAGLIAGVAIALALTRVVAALLYDVQPHDPVTLAAVAVLLAVVALAACYIPARRATRVDAVVALRTE